MPRKDKAGSSARSIRNRVPAHTSEVADRRLEWETQCRIQYYASHPAKIDERLAELDREWDIERTLEANAASVSLVSVLLGLFVSRKWFVVPGIIGGFLLQHAVQGWCPPLPLFRRMGVRTQTEIERERYALKALRGDFSQFAVQGEEGEKNRKKAGKPGNPLDNATLSEQLIDAVTDKP